MKLQDLLAVVPGDEKRAGLESPDRQQLEQDFSSLAYSFLKDRAPSLLPYLVGFEIVEADEDGSRAVGLFGFSVGKSFYYVPAFFLANQIKGMDLLYSKNDNQFIPLRENWIQHITDKQSIRLGGISRDKVNRSDMDTPDFTNMFEPPNSSGARAGLKAGLGGDFKVSAVMQDLCAAWNKMQATAVEMLEKDGAFGESLSGALTSAKGSQLVERTGSDLIDFIKTKGGPDMARKLALAMTDEEFVKAACKFYEPGELLISVFDEALRPKQAAEKKVTIVTATSDYDSKSGKHKTKLVRDGFYIDDRRDDSEKSEVYKEDYTKQVTTPSAPGRYKVYLVEEGLTDGIVLFPSCGGMNGCTVYLPESKNYFTASNTKVSVSPTAEDSPVPDTRLFDSAKSLADMEPGKRYLLIDKDMNSTAPFDLKSVTSDGTGVDSVLSLGVDFKTGVKFEDYKSGGRDYPCEVGYDRGDTKLVPTSGTGKIRRSGGTYMVPTDSWKAIELGDKTELENEGIYGNTNCKVRPADATDVFTALLKVGCHRMTVQSDDGGLDYAILLDGIVDSDKLGYKAACVRLVTRFGLPVEATEDMLKEAASSFKARRTVKLAQVQMPGIPAQPISNDQVIGVPTMQPQYEELPIGVDNGAPMQPSGPGTGINMGGEAEMQAAGGMPPQAMPPQGDGSAVDPQTMAMLQQAGMAGQRQVFDHAMIGSLAKTYDASTMIDGFIPEMMKALDRVGRTLFLFYWKNEDFAERYGAQDLMETEDQIRAVFKQFGDLILRLKQKSVDQAESMI